MRKVILNKSFSSIIVLSLYDRVALHLLTTAYYIAHSDACFWCKTCPGIVHRLAKNVGFIEYCS
jgi:hypothetical protein